MSVKVNGSELPADHTHHMGMLLAPAAERPNPGGVKREVRREEMVFACRGRKQRWCRWPHTTPQGGVGMVKRLVVGPVVKPREDGGPRLALPTHKKHARVNTRDGTGEQLDEHGLPFLDQGLEGR